MNFVNAIHVNGRCNYRCTVEGRNAQSRDEVLFHVLVEQTGNRCFQIQSWTASGSAGDQQQVRAAGDRQASEQAEEAGGRKPELGQPLGRLPHRRRLSGNAKNTSM